MITIGPSAPVNGHLDYDNGTLILRIEPKAERPTATIFSLKHTGNGNEIELKVVKRAHFFMRDEWPCHKDRYDPAYIQFTQEKYLEEYDEPIRELKSLAFMRWEGKIVSYEKRKRIKLGWIEEKEKPMQTITTSNYRIVE